MSRPAPKLLALFLLAAAAASPAAQTLLFPEGLQLYRINPLVITGIGPAPKRILTVTGRRWDGRTVALFRGPGVSEERGLRCWFYLDGDLQSVEVRAGPTGSGPLAAPVRTGTRVAVCGLPPSAIGPWYVQAADPAALVPGDVRVLEAGAQDPEPVQAAGIHVLLLGGAGIEPPAEAPPSAWKGRRLRAANPGAAGALLEKEKERLIEFKESCQRLVAEGSFYGARLSGPAVRALAFPGSRPADVAYTLQREQLAVRVGAPLGWALPAFYVPVLIAAAGFRRRGAVLLLAGVLLAGFVSLALLRPVGPRTLTVEFLPPEPGQPSADIRLVGTSPGPERPRVYRQEGEPPDGLRLVYRAASAPGGELPLPVFSRETLVRFNQVPEVRQEGGRLLLAFRNPLAAWSLYAAR